MLLYTHMQHLNVEFNGYFLFSETLSIDLSGSECGVLSCFLKSVQLKVEG